MRSRISCAFTRDMDNANEGIRKQPAVGDPAPGPIQGNGPAWEGKPLSVEPAVSQQDTTHDRFLPSGPEGSRDPAGRGSIEHGNFDEADCDGRDVSTLSLPGAVSCPAINPTGIIEEPGNNNSGSIALSGRPGDTIHDVDDAAATAQLEIGGASTSCGDVERARVGATEQIPTINSPPQEKSPSHAAGGGSDVDRFQEILQAAIRQSDAERAQDRESAMNFQKAQITSLLERRRSPEDQPTSTSTPGGAAKTPNRGVDDCGEDAIECRNAQDLHVEGMDSGLPSSVPSPALEPNEVERHWVRYVSPEGYAYLYDEVTGDSEWVVSGEEEYQSPDITSGVAYGEPGSSAGDLGEQDGQASLQGTASIKIGESGTKAHAAEGESIGTCEVSQWSQDTYGPDAR